MTLLIGCLYRKSDLHIPSYCLAYDVYLSFVEPQRPGIPPEGSSSVQHSMTSRIWFPGENRPNSLTSLPQCCKHTRKETQTRYRFSESAGCPNANPNKKKLHAVIASTTSRASRFQFCSSANPDSSEKHRTLALLMPAKSKLVQPMQRTTAPPHDLSADSAAIRLFQLHAASHADPRSLSRLDFVSTQ
jgi:hypothetical protein